MSSYLPPPETIIYTPPHRRSTGGNYNIGSAEETSGDRTDGYGHRHSMPPALVRKQGKSSFVPFPLSSSAAATPYSSANYARMLEDNSYDGRNDESEMVVAGDSFGGGLRQDGDDDSSLRSDGGVIALPPRRSGRHPVWHLTSYFSGGSPVANPRVPSPRPTSATSSRRRSISPPQPRRILCGSSLFHSGAIPMANAAEDGESRDDQSPFPVQARYQFGQAKRMSVQAPLPLCNHEIVGHPSLKIHRMRLPSHLLPLLDTVVSGCEMHAANLPCGWQTDLYSLTKQDIALREVPHIYNAAKPVVAYIKKAAALVYGVSSIRMDRNQPHVLKYNCENGRGHTGVELHHDKCDFTANLVLSRSETYVGGGTYFPDADAVVRLEFGEFLLHPGGLVHGGVNITQGTRYLMVMFADEK